MAQPRVHPTELASDLDTLLPPLMRREGVASLGVGLNIDGVELGIALDGEGRHIERDRAPLYTIGCLMDVIVAITCLDLHRRSGLDLDMPIESVLPALGPMMRKTSMPSVTPRHLLTRTSGICDPRTVDQMRSYMPREEIATMLQGASRSFAPGTAFSYGGSDRHILLDFVEAFAQQSLSKLAGENIVDPIGVTLRSEQIHDYDGDRPIVLSYNPLYFVRAIARLAGAGGAIAAYEPGLRQLMQNEALKLSRSVQTPAWPRAPTGFSLGLFRYSDGLIGFNGFEAGHAAAVRFDPQARISFVIGLEGAPGARDLIVDAIARRLRYHGAPARKSPCAVGGLVGVDLDEISGVYGGWAIGYEARVNATPTHIECDLSYDGDHFRHIAARLEDEVWLVMNDLRATQSLEFYRDPVTDRVCMSVGFAPYAKRD